MIVWCLNVHGQVLVFLSLWKVKESCRSILSVVLFALLILYIFWLLVYVRYICFAWNIQWTIGICTVYLFYLKPTMNHWYMCGISVLSWTYNELILIIGICTIQYICFTWNIQWTYLFYLENTMKLNALICFTWNIHWTYLFYLEHTMN